MTIEQTILSNLMYDDVYMRKVFPFLKEEYFAEPSTKVVYRHISEFINKYNTLPTKEALSIAFHNDKTIAEDMFSDISNLSNSLEKSDTNLEWAIDETEKYCKDRAVYNAIVSSIAILDGRDKVMAKDGIPTLLQEALGVCFDASVGHDYIDDAMSRHEFYNRVEDRIPFDLEYLNKITKGGVPRKTLNICLAGCVHPSTKVKIRYECYEKEVSISEIDTLLKTGYDVEVDSPDGYVPVNFFIDKGMWDEYLLELDNGLTVKCNESHLFETPLGWQKASELTIMPEQHFLTKTGYVLGKVVRTGEQIPIVDINVDHSNHRYYTNGVSSHNTGVGKSLFMCHVAASCLNQNKNVLYITMEMAEERIAERIDANLMNVAIDQLATIPKASFENRVKKITNKTTGKLIIKEYPTASAHVGHFKALLNELSLKRNFKPDVIFIDYLNICASSRFKAGANVNSYTMVKAIAEELRGMAVEYNLPVFSATQTTRSGYGNTDVELTDTSESFGLPATADFMFALISTEDLEKLGQLMVKQLKNRYNDPSLYKRFLVGVDRSKMRLYDLEEAAQRGISDSGNTHDDPIMEKFTKKTERDFSGFKM